MAREENDLSSSNKVHIDVIRSSLHFHLADLANLHSAVSAKPEHNVFLQAISNEISVMSKLSRSLTSKLGNKLAQVARELAEHRFGLESVPRVLISDGIDFNFDTSEYEDKQDTVIITNVDHEALETEGQRLISFAKSGSGSNRIGTKSFYGEYLKSMQKLRNSLTDEVSTLRVDLYVNHPELGFCELESGGELDTSNVKSQPLKLVKAGLAYGNPETGLHFCLSYANNGEGNAIKGGLTKYLTPSNESKTGHGLLVGSEWWNSVLPPEITHGDFLKLFREVTEELEILA